MKHSADSRGIAINPVFFAFLDNPNCLLPARIAELAINTVALTYRIDFTQFSARNFSHRK